jgi:Na+/H+-dicarboxylate symporter
MANNEMLQIVIFALFFGAALGFVQGQAKTTMLTLFEELSAIMFRVTDYVMVLAPIDVFAAMTSTITVQGVELVMHYGKLIGEFYLGMAIFCGLLMAAGYFAMGRSLLVLLGLLREPVILAFSTASREAAYPKMVTALGKFGASKRISSFVLPLGYSFNLDGLMMYQAFVVMFIAQAYNIELTFAHQVAILLTLMITSKGTAGVARASLVVVAATLPMLGLPESGMLLIIGIDPLLDMGRTATNVLGCGIATAVIARKGETRSKLDLAPIQGSRTEAQLVRRTLD